MTSVIYLKDVDFYVDRGVKARILCVKVPGVCVVFFFAPDSRCARCKEFHPQYRQLPGSIMGCQFAALDLFTYRGVAAMSEQTVFPIKYVPHLVLYVNGRPFKAFPRETKPTAGSVQQFVINSIQTIKAQYQFMAPQGKKREENGDETDENGEQKIILPPGIRKLGVFPYNLVVFRYMFADKTYVDPPQRQ
jgi:hypothetical protein